MNNSKDYLLGFLFPSQKKIGSCQQKRSSSKLSMAHRRGFAFHLFIFHIINTRDSCNRRQIYQREIETSFLREEGMCVDIYKTKKKHCLSLESI